MIAPAPSRRWRVADLTPQGTVAILKLDTGEVRDTRERPADFGVWGVTRAERAILHRGMTARERREARESWGES